MNREYYKHSEFICLHAQYILISLQKSIGEFMVCIQGQIKMDKLMREVNKSIERGELDLVFKKYCK